MLSNRREALKRANPHLPDATNPPAMRQITRHVLPTNRREMREIPTEKPSLPAAVASRDGSRLLCRHEKIARAENFFPLSRLLKLVTRCCHPAKRGECRQTRPHSA